MLRKATLFLLLSVALLFCLISCGGDNSTVEQKVTPAKVEMETVTAKKDQNILGNLKKSEATTVYSIDLFNEKAVTQLSQPIVVDGNEIRIGGWAVDVPNEKSASRMYVSVGNNDFPVDYGIERPDVAKALGNPNYLRSGYNAIIPLNEISKGEHTIDLKIVSANNDVYYLAPAQLKIDIK